MEPTTQGRALALLDFLADYYARRSPPVHRIQDYRDFLLREADLPTVPGIKLTSGGEAWLLADLLDFPPAPPVPPDLSSTLDVGRLSPHVRPTLVADAPGVEHPEPLQALVDTWVDAEWTPWAARWKEVDRSRAFYKELFQVRQRLERDRDTYELVWGFGRLRWDNPGGVEIDHPLLTLPVEMTQDPESGRFSIVPAGAPEVEYGFLSDVEITDRSSISALRQAAAAADTDPWNGATLRLTLKSLARVIHHDTVILEEQEPWPSSDRPAVSTEWVLYVRRRQTDYRGFLEDQRALYADAGVIPAPFASLVVDEPSRLRSDDAVPGGPRPAHLLPLPANEEQHRILDLAQARPGVTVQGPPGTGKSHTIANLISHFVAHGKRVLVTAEKEQALAVLADKIPEGIRALAVSILGSDQEARTRLEQSVNAIDARIHGVGLHGNDREAKRLREHLGEIDRDQAATTNRLRSARTAEVEKLLSPDVPGEGFTPSKLAAWLRDHEEGLGYIPDSLDLSARIPLEPEELAELASLATEIPPADAAAFGRPLPDPRLLPPAAELARAERELAELADALSAAETHIADWAPVDRAGSAEIESLAREVAQGRDWLAKTAGSWLAIVRKETSDPVLLEEWTTFLSEARADREAILAARRALTAHRITLPNEGPPSSDTVRALRLVRDRFAGGRGVNRLLQRAEYQVLYACRVDDEVPRTAEQVALCLLEVDVRLGRRRLETRWANQMGRIAGPEHSAGRLVEDDLAEHLQSLEDALAWRATRWPNLHARLTAAGIAAPSEAEPDEVERVAAIVELACERARERSLAARHQSLVDALGSGCGAPDASPLWARLMVALRDRAWAEWEVLRAEVDRLTDLAPRARRLSELHVRLSTAAPLWAERIAASMGTAAGAPELGRAAWQWRQLETWLGALRDGPDPSELQAELERLARERLRVVEDLVTLGAWQGLAECFDDRKRMALNRFVQANKKLGKGSGKYSARWQQEIRLALDEAKEAVPVWIMPIHRVLTSFRPARVPPFDVLIVDEASQVGILSSPILGLARKAIVVGDDNQTSPENVGLNREVMQELAAAHLSEVPAYRVLFDPDNSLYDLARQKFPEVVVLREHFRSLPEIIRFSSDRYYDGKIIPLRDRPPAPGWASLGTVFVEDGYHDRGTDTNRPEADAVVDLIAELCDEDSYAGMTFGVISLLGTRQAQLIQGMLVDRLGPSVLEERRIRCGEPANFQGDERDVVVLSVVAGHSLDGHGRMGHMNAKTAERRLNVAASRARNQLWVVHSVQPEDFSEGDPRAALIRHCREPGRVEAAISRLDERCESDFERLVLRRILARGYERVQVQHLVGQYRIDLVVEGPESRLAVECDGDAWHGPERWDADRARQAVLERAGWTFQRIPGSAFYRDPEAALEPLWARLEDLGIPTGDWAVNRSSPSLRRVVTAPISSSPELGTPSASETAAAKQQPRLALVTWPDRAVDEMPEASPDESVEVPNRHEPVESPQPHPLRTTTLVAATSAFSGDDDRRVVFAPRRDGLRAQPSPDCSPGNGPTAILQPYAEWEPRRLRAADVASIKELVDGLAEIVNAEGPLHAERAYQLYHRATGGWRVGKEIRHRLNQAAASGRRAGRLAQIKDTIPGQLAKTLYLPGSDPVLLRERGPRNLQEIPRSEIGTLVDQLGLRDAPPEVAKRQILDAFGLTRLTQPASDYLVECLAYRWQR